jgi:hypothetical protein
MAQADYPVNISQLNRNFYTFKLSRIPTVTFFLQKVTLPGILSPNFDQPTTLGVPVKRPLGTYNFANLDVEFIVDENMTNWLEIYRWMRNIGNLDSDCTFNIPENKFTSTGTLIVQKSSYTANITATFLDIFPISLGGIMFDTTLPASEPARVSASFAYTYYSFSPDPGNTTLD